MLAAPLIAGNDARSMTMETIDILTNREVLAVSQDSLGRQGYRVAQNGALAVALFNRADAPAELKLPWSARPLKTISKVRDLWLRQDLPAPLENLAATLPAHGVLLLRVTP